MSATTEHEALVATTKRIAAFAQLELATPPTHEERPCDKGVHFIVIVCDMDGGTGWDCRSTLCGVHAAKLLRAMANKVDEPDQSKPQSPPQPPPK